jgi:hypothetical protein
MCLIIGFGGYLIIKKRRLSKGYVEYTPAHNLSRTIPKGFANSSLRTY